MFIHRIRKMTTQESFDYAGSGCKFGHYNDFTIPEATHRVLGVEGGRRIMTICCDRCAAEIKCEVRSRPATVVTHGHDDSTYDGRKDFVSE